MIGSPKSRLCLLAASAAAASTSLSACGGDPQLGITFNIPQPYRGRIATVSIQVIQPSVAAPFTCDDIAFRRVDPSVVALAKVNEITSDSLNTPINQLSRTSSKLFWVDGLDQDRKRLVTGCGKIGEIKKDTKIEIVAEPVAKVKDLTGVSLSTPAAKPLEKPVGIPVRDALDQPLADVAAQWSIEGAAGEASSGQAKSDQNGDISINPDLPRRNGPFVLDVRVRWADRAPLVLSGFIRPDPQLLELGARALAFRSGAIGPNKEQGFAALVADSVLGGAKVVLVYRATNRTPVVKTSNRINGSPVLGVIDYSGAARDRVVAVSGTTWTEVSADGVLIPRTYSLPAGAQTPLRVLTTGPCGAVDPAATRVLIEFTDGTYAQYSPDGGAAMDPLRLGDPFSPRVDVVASGCVSDQANKLTRTWAIVVGQGIGVYAATRSESGMFQIANWLALSDGISFAPMAGAGRKQIFGAQLSVNDIVVSRATLDHPQADSLALKVEGLDSIPNVPTYTASGDIDGDGTVDVVGVFERGPTTMRKPSFWAVLGREHAGRRISGDVELFPAMPAIHDSVLMVLDLDGDGIDDIVLGELSPMSIMRMSRAQIYYMGR